MSMAKWAVVASLCLPPAVVLGQTAELTRRDDHALLYAHQLGFSSRGAPTVRMRIDEGMERVRFMPLDEMNVSMASSGGGVVKLKGGRVYEARLFGGRSGAYRQGEILARADAVDPILAAKSYCDAHGIESEVVSVGAVFALRGSVFDNRETLLVTKLEREAPQRRVRLAPQYAVGMSGNSREIYSELDEYPQGLVGLRDEDGNVEILHDNALWVQGGEGGIVVYGVRDERGNEQEVLLEGRVIFTPSQDGRLAVVQEADIETVLRGIVPAEIFASAPEAALMAQAVAARTTLVSQAGARHQADPYHLCNGQHCQVYRGQSGADGRTDEAIKRTRGEVLMHGGRLAQAYYSANCGGMAAGCGETWGLPEKPYLKPRSDDMREALGIWRDEDSFLAWHRAAPTSYCGAAPEGAKVYASMKHARWEKKVGLDEIERALARKRVDIGRVKKVEVAARGESFRVVRVRIEGSRGAYEISRELAIRQFFGGLKSALFVMRPVAGGYHFYGAGFGHGVGLCQSGAIGMALRGAGYRKILEHYYPETELRRLY